MSRYFVAFQFTTVLGNHGTSNMAVSSQRPICDIKDIDSLAEHIKEINPTLESVVIVNWRRFEQEE